VAEQIGRAIRENMAVHEGLLGEAAHLAAARSLIVDALRRGKKLLVFGNGGSAADAQHLAAELVGRFNRERAPLPAVALTTDTSILTALANDYGYEEVFSRQVRALGSAGDVACGISTSGNSANVVKGLEAAKELGLRTVALTGAAGGPVAEAAEVAVRVPSRSTPRIQEAHATIIHIICEAAEAALFGEGSPK
jgi:D-sedoheptulose 7-phosphate isomerase